MIYLIPFFCNLVTGLLALILVSYSVINDASFGFMAWLGAASAMAYSLNSKLAGRFTTSDNCRSVIISAVIGIFLSAVAASFIEDYRWSLPILILMSAAMGWFWAPYQIMLASNYAFSQLLIKISLYNLSWASGSTIGYALGGITLNLNFKTSILVTLPLAAVFVLLTIVKIPRKTAHPTEPTSSPENNVSPYPKPLLRNFIISAWLMLLCSGIIVAYLRTAHLKVAYELWQAKPWQQGVLCAMTFAVIPLISLVMAFTRKWILNNSYMIIAMLITAFIVGSLIVFPIFPVFLAAYAMAGLFNGFSFMNAIYYGCADSENRGANLGTNEMLIGAGSILGPLLGGYLSKLSTQAGIIMCVSLLCLTALSVFFMNYYKTSRQNLTTVDEPL